MVFAADALTVNAGSVVVVVDVDVDVVVDDVVLEVVDDEDEEDVDSAALSFPGRDVVVSIFPTVLR